MPQPDAYLLQSTAQSLSVDTILRPVSLGAGDSFSSYFTGVNSFDLASVAGVSGFSINQATLSPVLAQEFDQDILGDMMTTWQNFVDSGQLWALLFGIVIGYFVRNLTAF